MNIIDPNISSVPLSVALHHLLSPDDTSLRHLAVFPINLRDTVGLECSVLPFPFLVLFLGHIWWFSGVILALCLGIPQGLGDHR